MNNILEKANALRILEKVNALWNKKQIKVQVMLSLILQIVLIFSAPFRKRSSNKRLHLLLWLSYLGADYVATLALGSILANSLHNSGADLPAQSLTAFWAPFLLLHLGGPDNITSYSIEDNELWLRHLLSFVGQVSVALVVLVLSTLQTTRLLVPSILVFIVGTIKFGERTLALRSASMEQIKRSDGSLDLKYTDSDDFEGDDLVDVERDAQSNEVSDISDAEFIRRAYICFSVFKSHIFGKIIDISESLHHMGIRNADRYFKFIGVELSFLNDILHTKAIVVHHIAVRFIRIGSFVSTVIALFFFHISEKGDNETSDLIITYVLLSVALFLDIYSALYLVASNWMVISLLSLNKEWSKNLAGFICRAKNYILWHGNGGQWSGRMGQYSLIQIADERDHRSNWFKKASDFLFRGEKDAEVSDILEKTIIKNVGKRFERVFCFNDFNAVVKEIRSSWITNTLDRYDLTEIKGHMATNRFEGAIAWHVATDLCYNTANRESWDGEEGQMREGVYRVSNYMMYLFLKRSSMVPPGIPEIKAEETIETTKIILDIFRLLHVGIRFNVLNARPILYKLMLTPLEELPDRLQHHFDLSRDQSPIPVATLLVKHLNKIAEREGEERQWEVIRDAWMEMLTYAAIHCNRMEHVRGLSMGGELLTFHWLLLAHYGVVGEYNTNPKVWSYTMIRDNSVLDDN